MRVKRGVTARKRHNKIRSQTKGMTLSNRSSVRRGKQAVIKALENAHEIEESAKEASEDCGTAASTPLLVIMEYLIAPLCIASKIKALH